MNDATKEPQPKTTLHDLPAAVEERELSPEEADAVKGGLLGLGSTAGNPTTSLIDDDDDDPRRP